MVGCDSNDPEELGAVGDFDITVTGDAPASFTGTAVFAGSSVVGSTGFGVFLGSDPGGYVITLLKNTADRPSSGTYQIIDATTDFETIGSNEYVATFVSTDSGVTGSFVSVSGTVTITDSGDNQLKGRLNFTAAGTVFNGTTTEQVTASVSGNFDARGGGVFQGL